MASIEKGILMNSECLFHVLYRYEYKIKDWLLNALEPDRGCN